MDLNRDELRRYSRQMNLPELGEAGQKRLKAARVLCIGAGGLGSPAALYLAAAGIGTLGLMDDDVVDVSNLHRQLLHSTDAVGHQKTESAQERLRGLNPHVELEMHETKFCAENAQEIVHAYDVIIDGSDNLATRYLSSDVCFWEKKPNVYGSVHRFEGQASVFAPHLGAPCYRCLFPEPPPPEAIPSCAEAGVLGVVPGIIGTIQALEAIKLIASVGETLAGRLLHIDTLTLRTREFRVRRDRDCPVCGEAPTIFAPINYEQFCRGTTKAEEVPSISAMQLHEMLKTTEPPSLIDVREPFEFEIARLPDAQLIPLGKIADEFAKIPRDQTAVLICKSGVRSAHAIEFLRAKGFENLLNLEGGIDAWRQEVDPTMQKY